MKTDTRAWEMRNGATIADILRKVLREHADLPEPDRRGRAHTCRCGWWRPGVPWAVHLAEVLSGHGLDLGDRR